METAKTTLTGDRGLGPAAKVLEGRREQVLLPGNGQTDIACSRPSLAGSVSQRACVFCGSRVVLYPIADALHLVHGPVGCAAYTWDIRGSLSSGPELHRLSFSTDLREQDVIFGGEKRLEAALRELIARYRPEAAFVYGTCITGVIGDDVVAVCSRMQRELGLPVLPVRSEGFRGTKKDGYAAACEALSRLVGTGEPGKAGPRSINILGDFNLAGELWILADYYRRMGVEIVATITGDGRVGHIRDAHRARLNLLQCSGAMADLAKGMEKDFGIPCLRVSYFGVEDMSEALYMVARYFEDADMEAKAREIVRTELGQLLPALKFLKQELQGIPAAIYVGGAFKAISLVKALRLLGMPTVLVGSQTGNAEDYAILRSLCDPGTIVVDDTNPMELAGLLNQTGARLLIGGVKERPLAYKLGLGFCDHNHERKLALAGYEGMLNFAREVHATVTSPIWSLPRRLNLKGGSHEDRTTRTA